jgi:hypothetical protein
MMTMKIGSGNFVDEVVGIRQQRPCVLVLDFEVSILSIRFGAARFFILAPSSKAEILPPSNLRQKIIEMMRFYK